MPALVDRGWHRLFEKGQTFEVFAEKKKKSSTQPADGMFLNDTMFFVQDLLPAGNHCSFPGISFKDKNKNISFGEGDQKGDRCHSPTDQTAYQRRVSKRFLFGKGVHMYIIYIYIFFILTVDLTVPQSLVITHTF